ncbi:class I SAM-dependent methyltransferase, partial [Patescibacteria group bacterium]|nr:class I SAM-dependent methyltransferase [Patescibacteria group bacterium]
VQVLRTSNKKPIDPKQWKFTLREIQRHLSIQDDDDVLDLCCGNGLLSQEIAPKCKSVTSVDVASDLVAKIDTKKHKNISTHVKDIRELSFANNSFSKIVLYAGIQYLTYRESVLLFESANKWLRSGGIMFIGDIPDLEKKWSFYNNADRERAYFDAVKNDKAIVGTWFTKQFLINLANYSNYKIAKVIEQHKDMIYSHFRFDIQIEK